MSIFDAAISSTVGALAGALTATLLARSIAKRDRVMSEVHACNLAIAHSTAILNVYIEVKRQSIVPLLEKYNQQRQVFLSALFLNSGHHTIEFDFRKMPIANSSISSLNQCVEQQVRMSWKVAAVAANLTSAIQNQLAANLARNEAIDLMAGQPNAFTMPRYFAVKDANGHSDARYYNSMEGLQLYTDDCLYFAELLVDVLNHHANFLLVKHGYSESVIRHLEKSQDVVALLPGRDKYPAFEKQFRPNQTLPLLWM